MSSVIKFLLIGIFIALINSTVLATPPGIPVELSYEVRETGEGFTHFDLRARNIGLETTHEVTVAEAEGTYPAIYFGDLAPGTSASQSIRLTYQGEPPRLDWIVNYVDTNGRRIAVSYPQ